MGGSLRTELLSELWFPAQIWLDIIAFLKLRGFPGLHWNLSGIFEEIWGAGARGIMQRTVVAFPMMIISWGNATRSDVRS